MGRADILNVVNEFSVPDRLRLVEAILRKIREEESEPLDCSGVGLLDLAGIMNEDEATLMKEAVSESRQIDLDGW